MSLKSLLAAAIYFAGSKKKRKRSKISGILTTMSIGLFCTLIKKKAASSEIFFFAIIKTKRSFYHERYTGLISICICVPVIVASIDVSDPAQVNHDGAKLSNASMALQDARSDFHIYCESRLKLAHVSMVRRCQNLDNKRDPLSWVTVSCVTLRIGSPNSTGV